MNNIQISKLTRLTEPVADNLNKLIMQLNSVYKSELSFQELEKLISAETNTVFIATNEEGKIVGTVLFGVFYVYTGSRAFLENLVVDSEWRGLGIARQLVQAVIEQAKVSGVNTLKLSTGQDNKAANALYKSFGFELWTVNTYVLKIE